MNSITTRFFAALLIGLLCVACVGEKMTTPVLTESRAVELAKKEFSNTGRKVEDYRITVKNDSNEDKWIVWFDRDIQYPPPGSKHAVLIEKKTGRAVFMLGK